MVGDDRIDTVIEEKQSASKAVKTIGDIDSICIGNNEKNEEWNIPHSQKKLITARKPDTIMLEIESKPEGTNRTKYNKRYHLNTSRHSLGSSSSERIEEIIDKSYQSHGYECKNREVCFFAAPERVVDAYTS